MDNFNELVIIFSVFLNKLEDKKKIANLINIIRVVHEFGNF